MTSKTGVKVTSLDKVKKKSKSKSKAVAKDVNVVPFTSDDYVIANIDGKNKLGLMIGKSKFLPEDGAEDDSAETIKINAEQIVCNLGKKPKRGITALGIKVNPYEFTITDEFWGNIHFYISFKAKEGKEDRRLRYFRKCLDDVKTKLQEHKCDGFAPLIMRVYENTKSSAAKIEAGCYRFKPKGQDVLEITEIDFTDKDLTKYCLFHEAAHGVWFRQVPSDIKLEWIDCFNQRLEVVHNGQSSMERLRENLAAHEEGFNHFMKNECDEEETKTIKEAFSYVRRIHKLSMKQVQDYVHSRGKNSLAKFWPNYSDIVKPDADITEYAMTNHEEFFAESVAHYLTGKKLPKDVKKLVKHSLKNLIKEY